MTSALRHIVDDFRDKISRLRSRTPTPRPENSTTKPPSKNDLRRSIDSALPPSGRSKNPPCQRRRNEVRNETEADGRNQTPDLIRPHLVIAKLASLPPLPPPTTTSSTRHNTIATSRRSSGGKHVESASSGSHVYEEIPTLSRPIGHRRHGSASSSSSVACSTEPIGRIYYVSPMDGALCRLYPTSGGGDEMTERRHQIICPHVRQSSSGRPLDIASIADLISGSGTSMNGVRGRELRLCSGCRRHLRDLLGENSRDLNTCDLSLLHVPCPYASDDDAIEEGENDDDSHGVLSARVASDVNNRVGISEIARKAEDREHEKRRGSQPETSETRRPRPSLGVDGRSAFSKYAINRRNSMPVNNSPATSGDLRSYHRCGLSVENVVKSPFNHQLSSNSDERASVLNANTPRDVRRRPIVERTDEHVMNCFSSPDVADIDEEQDQAEVGYLCLYDCRCRRCREKFGNRVPGNNKNNNNDDNININDGSKRSSSSNNSSNSGGNIRRVRSSKHRTKSTDSWRGIDADDSLNNNVINRFIPFQDDRITDLADSEPRDHHLRRQHAGRRSLQPVTKSTSIDDTCSGFQVDDGGGRRASRRHRQDRHYRQQCDVEAVDQRVKRPPIKSVYYSGLLASMIDLTGCDVFATAAGGSSSADGREDDRLSCRATSGPRSWGLEILQRSRTSKKMDDDDEGCSNSADKKGRQWHRRRTSWVRRPAAGCGGTDVINVPLHRSVGDLQLTSLQ